MTSSKKEVPYLFQSHRTDHKSCQRESLKNRLSVYWDPPHELNRSELLNLMIKLGFVLLEGMEIRILSRLRPTLRTCRLRFIA